METITGVMDYLKNVPGTTMQTHFVSTRCVELLSIPSALVRYGQQVHADPYHPITNEQGYIDLGTAENKLCEDIMIRKLTEMRSEKEDPMQLYYPDLKGIYSFRHKLKLFIENVFKSLHAIDHDEIVVLNGTTSLIEILGFCLGDRGDYFMVPSPYYYRIKNDLLERAGIHCYDVPIPVTSSLGLPFHLTVDVLETGFQKALSEGRHIKALLLINPHNPLGDVYSREDLLSFLRFASHYQLHVIVDEIYALSVFDKNVTFHSVLSVPLPDPMRTHFIWGFSKDFGLSGYRCGILQTKNREVIQYATQVAIYNLPPPLVQLRLERLISDMEWVKKVYFHNYHHRLREHFNFCKERLERLGVRVHPSKAGIFLWADMGAYMPERSVFAEIRLQDRFLRGKVYVQGGSLSYCTEPGWFRIVFATKWENIEEGLIRIERVLDEVRDNIERVGIENIRERRLSLIYD